MSDSGYNPLRWNCLENGCFNYKCRPKIERLHDCFRGKINFGDVDGLVEISGRFALLEWKNDGGVVRIGQRMSFRAFTVIPGNVVFVVEGSPQSMTVKRYQVWWKGTVSPWRIADFNELKIRIKAWAEYVARDRGAWAVERDPPA